MATLDVDFVLSWGVMRDSPMFHAATPSQAYVALVMRRQDSNSIFGGKT